MGKGTCFIRTKLIAFLGRVFVSSPGPRYFCNPSLRVPFETSTTTHPGPPLDYTAFYEAPDYVIRS